jgi:hypothetical protein
VNFRSTMRTVLTRFVPSAATVLAVALGLIVLGEPRGLSTASLGVAALELLMLTTGYALSKAVLRPKSSSSQPSGRSHAIAGALAPIGLAALSPFAQGTNYAGIVALSVATGVVVGVAHWAITFRGSRPPRPTLEEQEAAVDAELAKLDSSFDLDNGITPISSPKKTPLRHRDQVA